MIDDQLLRVHPKFSVLDSRKRAPAAREKFGFTLLHILVIIFFCIILTIGSVYSIFQNPGLFSIHDDTQAARVIEMAKALTDHQFPVRWVSELGYGAGYPIFNFYSPLPYYFGGVLYLITQNAILSVKLMYLTGILVSFIFMYLLAREFIGDIAAFVPAVLYTYSPYHAVQIYVRGSVGEYWVYGLLPLVLISLYKSIKTKNIRWVLAASISISAVILSHNISAMIMYFFAGLYLLTVLIINIKKNILAKYFIPVFAAFFLAIGISSFYLIPAIFESGFTNVKSIIQGGSVYSDHFVYLDQLWDSPWGFAGSAPGRNDGMTFKIGKIQIIIGSLGIISLYLLYIFKKIKKDLFVSGNIFAFFLVLSIFMTTQSSMVVWNSFNGIFSFIQFPWRFLVFIEFFVALLSIYLFIWFKNNYIKTTLTVILIMIALFANQKYFNPQTFYDNQNSYYQDKNYLNFTASSISDEYLPVNFIKPKENVLPDFVVSDNKIDFKVTEKKSNFISFTTQSDKDSHVTVYNSFFPGWSVYVNQKETPVLNADGKISFDIRAGSNLILVIFKGSRIQIMSNMISFIVLVFLVIIYFKNPEFKFRQ